MKMWVRFVFGGDELNKIMNFTNLDKCTPDTFKICFDEWDQISDLYA